MTPEDVLLWVDCLNIYYESLYANLNLSIDEWFNSYYELLINDGSVNIYLDYLFGNG